MTYKGFGVFLEIDEDNQEIFGRVTGIDGIVTFHSPTVAGLQREFEKSVDVFLEFQAKRGVRVEKPCSGRFHVHVHVEPGTHRALSLLAESRGLSLNEATEAAILGYLDSAAVDPALVVREGRNDGSPGEAEVVDVPSTLRSGFPAGA